MKPNTQKILISDNRNKINDFLEEVVIYQHKTLNKWAQITLQSPATKIGYVGQHLASLLTGVQGTCSGARGNDLSDGTEVKSCNKIGQADKCKKCGKRVMRNQKKCPHCSSIDIIRKEDSKWLFSVKDEVELEQYLNLDRILLILMDYPGFDDGDFSSIRISAFEIYPKEERMKVFCDLIKNHYYNIYTPKRDAIKKTNPMNLHPFSFQFYKCNPIKVFECIIKNVDTNHTIEILEYVEPTKERGSNMASVDMPTQLLNKDEWEALINNCDYSKDIIRKYGITLSKEDFLRISPNEKVKLIPFIDEKLKSYIPLREIVSVTQKEHYHR